MSSNNTPNRPKGREKHVTGQGKDIYKKGEGLGSGPVGSQSGHAGRQDAAGGGSTGGGGRQTRSGSGCSPLLIIILAVVLLGGGGGLSGLFGNLLGGTAETDSGMQQITVQATPTPRPQSQTQTQPQTGGSGLDLSSLLGMSNVQSFGSTSTGWSAGSNVRKLDTTVAAGARAKRTQILGNGQDTVTIMVYMCGTDLESKNGMGTADLNEMISAEVGDSINLIVYTGGCRQWRNNVISSSANQIYQVKNGQIACLVADAGSAAMTNPDNLAGFIQFCASNFPANRNELILWDHGGGSLSGYGYDEKNSRSGSMSLRGIDQALKAGGVSFDFIGFDACLMATLETGLMLTDYADYMVASEETEPGVGWYYTNWLTKLNQNPSMSTLELGRNIVDDFVSVCGQKCRGQQTTLSVVDLAELELTAPPALKSFSSGTSSLLQSGQYQQVSNARSSAREFASSSRIDQIDLVDLAQKMNTAESQTLAKSLLGAVKYNNTSSDMTNAYGLSIYFPYRSASKVSSAVSEYSAIGMDDDYSKAIQQFASYSVSGQAVSGGASSPLDSLFGSGSGSSGIGEDAIYELLGSLLGGRSLGGVKGLDSENADFLLDSIDPDAAAAYLAENRFDASALVWTGDAPSITLSEKQWSLVNDLELNLFYDDGEGYIDMGLDNVYDFGDDGSLLAPSDSTWLAIDQQPVPYYHIATTYEGDDYAITGYVPCLLTREIEGETVRERAKLLLVFDTENPYGSIVGAVTDYHDGETETIAKSMTELNEGDEITFLCDYYSYDGEYQDSYQLGESWVYHSGAEISDVVVDGTRAQYMYRFTDLYGQTYWTPPVS